MKKRTKRILIIVVALILAAGTIVYFIKDDIIEDQVRQKLATMINENPQGYYVFEFDELDLRLLERKLILKGITIRPKPQAFDSLLAAESPVRALFELQLKRITLHGFDVEKFMSNNKIEVASLVIQKPQMSYYFNPTKKKPDNKTLPLKEIFSDALQEARLGRLTIEDAGFDIVDYTKDGFRITVKGLDIDLDSARMSRATLEKILPFDYVDIKVSADGLIVKANEDFDINSGYMSFIVSDKTIIVHDLQINPRLSRKQFAKKYRVQKQWFALVVDSLRMNNLDIPTFMTTGIVHVQNLAIYKPNVALYKDKSKPMPPFKKKLLPASALRQIPWSLMVDTVAIHNGTVIINETSALTGQRSHLSFYQLNGNLYNFTNDSSRISQNPYMTLTASTRVMNQAPTTMKITVDLSSTLDYFEVEGRVGRVKADAFNKVLHPMMGVKVLNGLIHQVIFSFSANDTLSTGGLDIDYENLKIEVSEARADSEKTQRKGFMTFAANTLVKTHNRPGNKNYLHGIIYTERNQQKDIWPYLWHAIQSGLVSSMVPITNDKEKRQKQREVRQQTKVKRKKQDR